MFRHNFLVAFRNLKRHKISFVINLIGLSTGLACACLIYLWVTSELKFDKFHKNDANLYQVMEKSSENGNIIIHEATQGPLSQVMKNDLPEVDQAISILSLQKYNQYVPMRWNEKAVKTSGLFAGSNFFDVFTFNLKSGNASQVLKNKQSIVISENLAVSLFGSPEKAVGKNVEWELFGRKQNSAVSGVFATPPADNSMKFDFVLPWDLFYYDLFTGLQQWYNEGPDTYLVLKEGTNVTAFNAKIEKFINKYHAGTLFTLFTRPYSSAYLYGNYENGVQSGGRIEYVKLFSIIAIFILIIACINFMNLSTAKASRRLKEVGVKKAIGSTRRALMFQFLSEAVFMAFLSLIAAVVIAIMVLPVFNTITGKELSIDVNPRIISLALLVTFVTGIVSGSYPAFYMSGFDVISVFRGKLKRSFGELMARKGLVVFQFIISLVLMVAVMVILKQVDYVQKTNLGFNRTNVIHFDKEGTLVTNREAFITGLRKIPGVVKAAEMQENVMQPGLGSSTYGIQWPGKPDKMILNFAVRAVDYDLFETMGFSMAEGRTFSKDFGSDSSGLIFNETAIKQMGLKNPVGTKVTMWGKEKTIVGVVKDFHFSSFHEPIAPIVFWLAGSETSKVIVRIAQGRERETIAEIDAYLKAFNPGYVFEYKFLDEIYQAQYISEQRVSLLSKYFAGLAIIISCLGLFGLATFNAEVRTKEIGIRKVLGASVSNVMMLLSKDFILLIVVSMLIAFPIAWWAMNSWLNGFAYRISIEANVFVIAGVAMILLTMITVGYQSIRSAVRNPVNSLRTE
jgi:putative ABC transport system permease protein